MAIDEVKFEGCCFTASYVSATEDNVLTNYRHRIDWVGYRLDVVRRFTFTYLANPMNQL
jgi:hypothetical protein